MVAVGGLLLIQAASCSSAWAWQEYKTTHFIVYYKNIPFEVAQKIGLRAEDCYTLITENLGMRRFNFWLWDNRASIYIHNDAGDYQFSTNRPAWSGGFSLARNKVLHTFLDDQGFYEATLDHEIGHIIFREAVGFTNPAVPIWLEEGVASLQEYPDLARVQSVMKAEIARGNVLSLERLSEINPSVLSQRESGNPLYQEAIRLFYLQSVSICGYLLENFSKEAFNNFCQELKSRKNLDAALEAVYPFKNTPQLIRGWEAYIRART